MRVVILIIVIIAAVVVCRYGYELFDSRASSRIAVLPIKVWEQLSADYICWILPGDRYTVADDYAQLDWTVVKSARCHGIAQVKPSR